MGTVAYMSPEQARGEKLDARTDLFSFGAVLYQMATGQQTFYGTTMAVIYEAILNRAPVSPISLNPSLPAKLEEIINKALEKDRDLRCQTAAELRADLMRLKRDADSGRVGAAIAPAVPSSQGVPANSGSAGQAVVGHPEFVSPRRSLWLGGALALVLAGLGVAWFLLRRSPQPPAELTQKRLTFNSSENPVQSDAISPDGKYLAYSDLAGIHIKLISTSEERVIPKPAGVPAGASWFAASWFPDGTHLLADAWGAGKSMWVVSILGQSARELREAALGCAVSPDGTRIVFVRAEAGSRPHDEIWVTDSQGENPQRVLTLAENESIWNLTVRWSADGERLAYIKAQFTSGGTYQTSIETCDLWGANRTVVPSSSDLPLRAFCWLPDGRIVYSRQECPTSIDDNLWQIDVDGRTGTPTDKPKRITQWAGSLILNLDTNANGKRLVLTKSTFWEQVYLAELAAGGTRMSPPRRLSNDESRDLPTAWTADSKAVLFYSDRDGPWGVFKQGISQDTAEPVVTGAQNSSLPRLSPDGAWILYRESSKTVDPSTPTRLMRIPVSGGVPEFVLETQSDLDYWCARAPASFCVFLEESQDPKHFTLTAFDPLKGRGKVLRTIEQNPSTFLGTALSPDGSTFAISSGGEAEVHIRLLSLSGGSDREITAKGWPNLTGLDWSSNGKGLYCGSVSAEGSSALLYIDLAGNTRVLWEHKGAMGNSLWGVPSPDGRFLAIRSDVINNNVWMLEGF